MFGFNKVMAKFKTFAQIQSELAHAHAQAANDLTNLVARNNERVSRNNATISMYQSVNEQLAVENDDARNLLVLVAGEAGEGQ